jgi:hypothetical protein
MANLPNSNAVAPAAFGDVKLVATPFFLSCSAALASKFSKEYMLNCHSSLRLNPYSAVVMVK